MLQSFFMSAAMIVLVAVAVWSGLVVSFVTLSRIAVHADVKDARALESSGHGVGS
jgi:hypothetical protein